MAVQIAVLTVRLLSLRPTSLLLQVMRLSLAEVRAKEPSWLLHAILKAHHVAEMQGRRTENIYFSRFRLFSLFRDQSLLLQVMRLIRLAEVKAKELSALLQASLKAHDVERVQARIRRHQQTAAAPKLQGRAVTILNSDAVSGRVSAMPMSRQRQCHLRYSLLVCLSVCPSVLHQAPSPDCSQSKAGSRIVTVLNSDSV